MKNSVEKETSTPWLALPKVAAGEVIGAPHSADGVAPTHSYLNTWEGEGGALGRPVVICGKRLLS